MNEATAYVAFCALVLVLYYFALILILVNRCNANPLMYQYVYGILPSPLAQLDVVIAHYKEDLSWVDNNDLIPPHARIFIYTKGDEHPNVLRQYHACRIQNVGRCDHTYLKHITLHYDDLADNIVFLPGSANALPLKRSLIKPVVYGIQHASEYLLAPHTRREKYDLDEFRLESYCNAHKRNRHTDCAVIKSQLSFAQFRATLHLPRILYWFRFGLFATTSRNIRQHPHAVYQKAALLMESGDHVEEGHYMERCWFTLLNLKKHCHRPNNNANCNEHHNMNAR